jgi:hypothetical protein
LRRRTESLISCSGYWREQEKISLRIYRRTQPKQGDCELDAEEASDKPHRDHDREITSEKLQKFPSDIMAWHRGGQSAKNECL